MADITPTNIQKYLASNPGLSDASIASLMNQYGVSPAQVAAATGLSTEAVQNRYAPSVTFSASRDSGEGGQTGDQYFINGQPVNPISSYSSGGAYDTAPNATIGGYTGSVTHIGNQDYIPHYNASGQLTGYTPYAGGSWLDSGLVDMVKFLGPAVLAGSLAGGALGSSGTAAGAGLSEAELAAAYDAGLTGVGTNVGTSGLFSGLTATQIANLAKAGVSIAGLLGGGAAIKNVVTGDNKSTTGTTGTTMSGSTNYSPEYYSQIQQYYNKYLPEQPKDVVSPLAAWYNSTFTPSTSTSVSQQQQQQPGLLTPSVASAMLRMGNAAPSTTQQQIQQMSIADKANTYTDLLNAGLTDAQAKNIVESKMGSQTNTDWNYLQNAAKVQNISKSTDPLVKAQEYNSLLSSGMTDSQIRDLVESAVGPQTNTDWQYLQQLASR